MLQKGTSQSVCLRDLSLDQVIQISYFYLQKSKIVARGCSSSDHRGSNMHTLAHRKSTPPRHATYEVSQSPFNCSWLHLLTESSISLVYFKDGSLIFHRKSHKLVRFFSGMTHNRVDYKTMHNQECSLISQTKKVSLHFHHIWSPKTHHIPPIWLSRYTLGSIEEHQISHIRSHTLFAA